MERCDVIVIDNGSANVDAASVPAGTQLLHTGGNLGYAGGNNVGIRHALDQGASYVWVLNNDAGPEPSALSELVDAAESDESWGALTSRVLTPEGIEDRGLIGRLPGGQRWDPFGRPPAEVVCRDGDRALPVELVTGPSLLLRGRAC